MAINLSRNTKLFISTVKSTLAASHTAADTFEIPVLDGYSFSQDAESQTIALSEAGDRPVRGQKIFNTALAPAEVSIPTYVRPYYNTTHSCAEQVLWEAMVGNGKAPSVTTATVGTNAKRTSSYLEANFDNSNVHELLKLYLFFQVDNAVYRVNEFSINTAEVDFSIDAISMITWNGQATTVEELLEAGATGSKLSEFTAWAAGTDYLAVNTTHLGTTKPVFIKNKLSSINFKRVTGTTSALWPVDYANSLSAIDTDGMNGTLTYTVDVTVDGGSLQTISIDSSAAPWTDAGITVQDVIDEINYQLDGAVCYIASTGVNAGDLVFVSSTSGTGSNILVANGATNDLLAALDNVGTYSALGSVTAATGGAGTTYSVPITGGSLTIDNGITYLTPEVLGVVNTPIGSLTGSRVISGSLTAYLNTGSTNTGGVLNDLLSDTSTVTQEYEITISMGGASNVPKVEFIMNHAHLVIPSINVEDVLSTEMQFTALGEEITENDELVVRYYSPTS